MAKHDQFNMFISETDRARLRKLAKMHNMTMAGALKHVVRVLTDHDTIIRQDTLRVGTRITRRTVEVEERVSEVELVSELFDGDHNGTLDNNGHSGQDETRGDDHDDDGDRDDDDG